MKTQTTVWLCNTLQSEQRAWLVCLCFLKIKLKQEKLKQHDSLFLLEELRRQSVTDKKSDIPFAPNKNLHLTSLMPPMATSGCVVQMKSQLSLAALMCNWGKRLHGHLSCGTSEHDKKHNHPFTDLPHSKILTQDIYSSTEGHQVSCTTNPVQWPSLRLQQQGDATRAELELCEQPSHGHFLIFRFWICIYYVSFR